MEKENKQANKSWAHNGTSNGICSLHRGILRASLLKKCVSGQNSPFISEI